MKVNKKKVIGADVKSTLNKAVKNVKEMLETENVKTKNLEFKPNDVKKKIFKKKRKNLPQCERKRGIVYVGHIPHGFYEEQMKDYFKQFGLVTRVRLSRSKQSGKSRGYGYVEFADPGVAKIAAETMNNYLMFGRLIKATYVPPEKQHDGFFTQLHWTRAHYPRKLNRCRETKIQNASETKDEHKIFVAKSVKRLRRVAKRFKDQGIDLKMKVGRTKV